MTTSLRVTEPRGLDPGNRSLSPSYDSQDMRGVRVQLQWGRTVTPQYRHAEKNAHAGPVSSPHHVASAGMDATMVAIMTL